MALVQLPGRSKAGERRQRGVGLPQAEDVPNAGYSTDPGLRVPEGAFDEGIGDAAPAIAEAGRQISAWADKTATRQDVVERARALNEYNVTVNEELRRIETEEDLSRPEVSSNYGKFILERQNDLLNNYGGTEDGRALLTARLEGVRADVANRAGAMTALAQRKMVQDHLGREISAITSGVISDPSTLTSALTSFDAALDDAAPGLSPEEEETYRQAGYQEITISALQGAMTSGDLAGARRIYETPGVVDMLSPQQQRQYTKAFDDAERERTKHITDALSKVQAVETVLGRPATLSERLAIMGIPQRDKKETLSDKLNDMETALGRPLTPEERNRAVGLGGEGKKTSAQIISDKEEALGRPLTAAEKEQVVGLEGAKPQTDAGKSVFDRELVVGQFGEGSPQVEAFDELNSSQDPPSLSDVGGIRKEFTAQSQDFITGRDAFGKLAAAAKQAKETKGKDGGAPLADVALIFGFMKMLDPRSVVREGEFATAQNATGVPNRLRNIYNQVQAGTTLNETQRQEIIDQAKALMRVQIRNQINLEDSYRDIATRAKVGAIDDVVVDFIGDYRNGLDQAEEARETGGAPVEIIIGPDGKPVGGWK